VTDGDDNVPIWAGQPDTDDLREGRWSADIPTAVLMPGIHRVRVWAFRAQGIPMPKLGDDVELQIR
jgi:hypothetical protein